MTGMPFHQAQYVKNGYTVFASAVSNEFISNVLSRFELADAGELVAGDESSHSWREFALSEEDIPAHAALLTYADAVLGAPPVRASHWLNVYNIDEFIAGHVDAGGEAQLMVPLEMPPAGSGGDIWIGSQRQLIPLSVGDALLFAAHRQSHGTTAVNEGRRISLNIRLWLSD
ncbi:2OG-Fe(II) oxygenase [Rhodobacteraceae bacterium]|nr:2OG-Fe(II) oxygenase [Paracoccaceae bacterium]